MAGEDVTGLPANILSDDIQGRLLEEGDGSSDCSDLVRIHSIGTIFDKLFLEDSVLADWLGNEFLCEEEALLSASL